MMQGYDDRFFVPEAPDTYLCGICSLVLRDPVQIVRCGHYFCGPCFTQYRTCCTNAEPRPLPVTCPLDRRPVTPQDFHDDVGMRRIVENLPARCPSGCGFAGCAVEVDGHATTCSLLLQPNRQNRFITTLALALVLVLGLVALVMLA